MGYRAVAINGVWYAKTRPLPLAGLLKQMSPGDPSVVRAVKPDAREALSHGLMRIRQEAACMSDPGKQSQVSFGNTESQVSPVGLAPASNQPAFSQNNARNRASGMHRPEQTVPGRGVCIVNAPGVKRIMRLTRPVNLMGLRKGNSIVKQIHFYHSAPITKAPVRAPPSVTLAGKCGGTSPMNPL